MALRGKSKSRRRSNGRLRIPIGQFTVVLSPEPEGGFTVTVPALPGCISHGDSIDKAKANAREAIECHIGSLLKHGEAVPSDQTISTTVLVGQP